MMTAGGEVEWQFKREAKISKGKKSRDSRLEVGRSGPAEVKSEQCKSVRDVVSVQTSNRPDPMS